MKKVAPYRSMQGAARALDNGGRFFNLFTHAGDDVVTRAELSRVAGITGGLAGALLFFEMSVAGLPESDRSRLVSMMEPSLRRRYEARRPQRVDAREFATHATAGDLYVVEGRAKLIAGEAAIGGSIAVPVMVGTVTTISMIPIVDLYDVYEITSRKTGTGCRLLLKKKKKASRPAGDVRWGGAAREHATSDSSDAEKSLYLEPSYYTPL